MQTTKYRDGEKMKTVLVTGSTGFIGGHLTSELIRQGYEVVGFDKNPTDVDYPLIVGDIVPHDFTATLEDYDISGVFHLAGVLGTTELFHRVVEAERVNVEGTLNLLEAMRKTGVNDLVFTSKPNLWRYNPYFFYAGHKDGGRRQYR